MRMDEIKVDPHFCTHDDRTKRPTNRSSNNHQHNQTEKRNHQYHNTRIHPVRQRTASHTAIANYLLLVRTGNERTDKNHPRVIIITPGRAWQRSVGRAAAHKIPKNYHSKQDTRQSRRRGVGRDFSGTNVRTTITTTTAAAAAAKQQQPPPRGSRTATANTTIIQVLEPTYADTTAPIPPTTPTKIPTQNNNDETRRSSFCGRCPRGIVESGGCTRTNRGTTIRTKMIQTPNVDSS